MARILMAMRRMATHDSISVLLSAHRRFVHAITTGAYLRRTPISRWTLRTSSTVQTMVGF